MTRRTAARFLAGLWLLDGLLQLQPRMFTMAMVAAVMQPVTAGNPPWANAALRVAIDLFTHHIVICNGAVAAVQLFLGVSLLIGDTRAWPFWCSLAWAALLWPFGQAYGGLFSGGASLWSGAPGSAVGYGLLTWAAWPLPCDGEDGVGAARRRRGIALALGAVWALGAVLQTSTPFFTAAGLSGLVTGMVPGQPVWLAALLKAAGRLLARDPVFCNTLATGVCAACALAIWTPKLRRAGLALSVVASALAWVFGQAFGMIFTGMATDPNTAPLLALLAFVAWPRRLAGAAEPKEPSRDAVTGRREVRDGAPLGVGGGRRARGAGADPAGLR